MTIKCVLRGNEVNYLDEENNLRRTKLDDFLNMNNKGKTSTLMGVGVVALLLILGFLVYGQYSNTALGGAAPNSGGAGSIVTTATTLSFSGVDALSPGTGVTGVSYISVNGAPYATGITTVTPGSKIDVLYTNGSTNLYHAAVIKDLTVSGTNAILSPQMYGNASSITLTAFNTNNAVINGVATNQTVAVGGSYTLKVRMDGQSQKSTQDMIVVIEANSTALQPGQQGIIMQGGAASYVGTAKPAFYTLSNVNNGVWTYSVAPVSNGQSTEYTIQFNSAAGKTLGVSTAKVTFYTKEYFLDSQTGKVLYDIQDTLGNQKSIGASSTTITFQ